MTRVASPYDEGGERQISAEGADAGNIAYAQVDLDPDLTESDFVDLGKSVRDAAEAAEIDGLQVEAGGVAFAEFETPSSEALGVAFAIFILILAFGSVLAMGLPIGVALAGIGAGTVLAGFISFVIHPPSFASLFGVMIGLGVGIDYALFIVTRYRENLHKGYDERRSVAIAMDTAGRAVLFAGTTVVISVLGMIVMQLSFVTGLAVAVATVVALTMLASVTLLPALLGFAGSNDRGHPAPGPGRRRRSWPWAWWAPASRSRRWRRSASSSPSCWCCPGSSPPSAIASAAGSRSSRASATASTR